MILAEADRLAAVGNWVKARPLFAQAEQLYSKRGDTRNALYTKFGRLHTDVETMSYTEVSSYLAEELENPIVKNDAK